MVNVMFVDITTVLMNRKLEKNIQKVWYGASKHKLLSYKTAISVRRVL